VSSGGHPALSVIRCHPGSSGIIRQREQPASSGVIRGHLVSSGVIQFHPCQSINQSINQEIFNVAKIAIGHY